LAKQQGIKRTCPEFFYAVDLAHACPPFARSKGVGGALPWVVIPAKAGIQMVSPVILMAGFPYHLAPCIAGGLLALRRFQSCLHPERSRRMPGGSIFTPNRWPYQRRI